METPPPRYLIRPMIDADLPQIATIEKDAFPSIWPASAYQRELHLNSLARYIVVVDREGDQSPARRGALAGVRRFFGGEHPPEGADGLITGFLGVWHMVDEEHIVTVATRLSYRRHGVGERLLLGAFDLAASKGLDIVTLECRVSNTAAQALYEKYGFERVGLRPRYYTDTNEDAIIMTTPSTELPEYRARLDALRQAHIERWGEAEVQHAEIAGVRAAANAPH